MKPAKRTYVLPPDTVARFEQHIEPGKRSAVISELIDKYLENSRREALRRDIEEGCREMWDVYLDAAQEWEATDDALHHTIQY
jgi:hypothetical protein